MMSFSAACLPRTRTGGGRALALLGLGNRADALPEELSGARSNVLPLPGRWSADLS